MRKSTRTEIYTYLIAIFLVYSTIANFSVYYIGVIPKFFIIVLLCIYGLLIRPSIIAKERNYNSILFILGWGIIFFISLFINGIFPRALLISGFVICLLILSFKTDIQISVFRKYVWIISIFFLLSAFEYIIFILIGKGVIIATVQRVTLAREGSFYHYLFNIISIHNIIYRFKGLCAEPGDMGTLCAFMLFATWRIKSLRFPFFVFLICGMMSLSLAYYIFLFVFLITSVKPNVKNILIGVAVFTAFIFVFRDYFEGRLINRLTKVDDVEELDNRTTDTFDRYFSKAFDEGELWLGVGSDNLPPQIYYNNEGGNAGAKKWIFQYGIIGFVIIFYIYNIIYYRRCKKHLRYHDIVFLVVYWACFYKSAVFTTSSIFIIFIMMPLLNKGSKLKNTPISRKHEIKYNNSIL